MATVELELETALKSLCKSHLKVTKKEDALGVDAKNQLQHLINSPFLTKKMNARALKTRIRERLQSRKFELDCLERSYRKQRSGKSLISHLSSSSDSSVKQRINEHTQDSVQRRDPGISELACRYNRLCNDMEMLIRQRKAPRNSVALLKIEMERLFTLDVENDIWLDVGIGYEEE